MNFSRFVVENLHGSTTFDVPIRENRLVIVGENGSGKTTLMNLMYYFLSAQWYRLAEYRFDQIYARIDDQEFVLRGELFRPSSNRNQLVNSSRRYGPAMERRVRKALETIAKIDPERFLSGRDQLHDFLARNFELPVSIIEEIVASRLPLFEQRHSNELEMQQERLKALLDCQILYLPTYRRIEQELKRIFPDMDMDDFRRAASSRGTLQREGQFIELVEFGMTDVQFAIEQRRDHLREYAREQLNLLTLSYLREIIDFEYHGVNLEPIRNANDATINRVIERIDANFLPAAEKTRLRQMIGLIRSHATTDEHAKMVAHFFLKLLALHQRQHERQTPLRKFAEICNVYLHPLKEVVYDDTTFETSIIHRADSAQRSRPDKRPTIDLQDLSSGEKQIVSLFSHLILSATEKFFVLIDEPELSLSVPWQQRFLGDIISSGRAAGLIAVTHSPFIYENSLDQFARGISEFIR